MSAGSAGVRVAEAALDLAVLDHRADDLHGRKEPESEHSRGADRLDDLEVHLDEEIDRSERREREPDRHDDVTHAVDGAEPRRKFVHPFVEEHVESDGEAGWEQLPQHQR